MFICMYIRIYLRVYVYIHIYTYVQTCIYIYMSIYSEVTLHFCLANPESKIKPRFFSLTKPTKKIHTAN